jgi:hypothetical protein
MRVFWILLFAAVLAAAGLAGQSYGLAAAAAIGLPGAAIAAWGWLRAGRRPDGNLRDESVSTLVFPPESRLPR